jgi:hydroxyacylglutathione hydrolase
VGALIADLQQPILLVTAPGKEEETVTRLARVGYDHSLGYLQGGMAAWIAAGKETDMVNRISAAEFAKQIATSAAPVLDVRREGEFMSGHLEAAENRPLDTINDWMPTLSDDEPFFLHCAGGFRSMIAASILKSRGIHHFSEVEGGYNAIKQTEIPTTEAVHI